MRTMKRAGWVLLLFSLPHMAMSAQTEAKVDWDKVTILSTTARGEVARVNARPGERASKGSKLVELDARVQRARQQAAGAEVAHQKLLFAEAESELERSEELYDRTLLSDHDRDLARIAHASAKSSYQRAIAKLRKAEDAFARMAARMPFDGYVLEQHVREGEMVNGKEQLSVLMTIASANTVSVELKLSSKQVADLKLDAPLSVVVAGKKYSGKVTAISYHTDGAVVSVTIPFNDNPYSVVGTTATVELP